MSALEVFGRLVLGGGLVIFAIWMTWRYVCFEVQYWRKHPGGRGQDQ